MSEPTVRVRATVHGRVQGVGYRMFAAEQAGTLGVRGTVDNRPDGTVVCVAEGGRAEIDRLVARLRQGPWSARVDRVEVVEESGGSPLPSMGVGW